MIKLKELLHIFYQSNFYIRVKSKFKKLKKIRITPDLVDNIQVRYLVLFLIRKASNLGLKLDLSGSLFKFARYFENYSFINFLYEKAFLYPVPLNLNYLWNFGSLAFLALMIQIITGILLACWYLPDINFAFESVEFIMREVSYGWFLRYAHANGASFFFIFVYIHLFRGLYYGSFLKPREWVWVSGMAILFLMIITAFLGYVLPWGQMSYWAATVITSLVGIFPLVGENLLVYLWGGFYIGQQTLTKFYALHFLLPFVILGLVILHLIILHEFGSNNPLGISSYEDSIPFGPYFITKDIFGFIIFFFLFSFFIFFFPNFTIHPDNYIKANFEITPEHIVPEWYFLPFYGLLRSVPNKLFGVLCLLFGIIVLFLIPFIYETSIRSSKFKPYAKSNFWWFVVNCLLLGWAGGKPVIDPYFPICCLSAFNHFFLLIVGFPISDILDDYFFNKIEKEMTI